MEAGFAQTNGIRLHYLDHGGDGPPLVLFHGLSANAHFFDALVEDGLGKGFRVIAVDLRGRGLSDKPATGYSIENHVDDVVGLLDHLGLEAVHVGGHSFGGLCVYDLVSRHPARVQRCIVLDTPPAIGETIVEQVRPALKRLDETVPSFDAYLLSMQAQPFFEGWWDPRIEAYYRADVEELADGSVRARASSDAIGQAVEAAAATDWRSRIREVRMPTLFIRAVGPYGPPGYPAMCQPEAAMETLDILSDGRLVEVEGNHMTAFWGNRAQRVADTITGFLTEES